MSVYSPLTRGCFSLRSQCCLWHGVFPAHAGVFLHTHHIFLLPDSIPRSRGGVSHFISFTMLLLLYSPLTRGCFSNSATCNDSLSVFPAHAGVFLWVLPCPRPSRCIPRSRGGVSKILTCVTADQAYSPLTRGCFSLLNLLS